MKTFKEFVVEKKDDGEGALKYVKKEGDKWALYSIHTGKNLKFWDHKPSREEADEALKAVEYYKHK